MNPGETKKEVLKELRQTRKDMMSAVWVDAIRKKAVDVRREAALKLADVKDAIHELQNAELAEIRDKLIENETDLLKGTERLSRARKNLTQVREVLDAAGALLETLVKVAKFVVTLP